MMNNMNVDCLDLCQLCNQVRVEGERAPKSGAQELRLPTGQRLSTHSKDNTGECELQSGPTIKHLWKMSVVVEGCESIYLPQTYESNRLNSDSVSLK